MASKPRPIQCPPSAPNGFLFDRAELVLFEDGNVTDMLDMSDMLEDVYAFSRIKRKIKPGGSFLISQSDVSDDLGFVDNIIIRIDYPLTTTVQKRYAYWYYTGTRYNIGELMILSGGRVDLLGGSLGWKLTPDDPFYNTGGIILENPSESSIINVEILIAR